MADLGERSAHTGADLIRRQAEAFQQAWQSGSDVATRLTRRSTEQVAQAFGVTGEEAEKATQQSSQNLEAIAHSGTIVAQGMQAISLEWFEFMRKRAEQNVDWFDSLTRCRTPQELAAVQSQFVRDSLEDLLQTGRRLAEMSMRMTDRAVRNVTEGVELAPGEA